VSTDNINFSQSEFYVPYTGGQLAPTTIYVRTKSDSPPGPLSWILYNYGGFAGAGYADVLIEGVINPPALSRLLQPALVFPG